MCGESFGHGDGISVLVVSAFPIRDDFAGIVGVAEVADETPRRVVCAGECIVVQEGHPAGRMCVRPLPHAFVASAVHNAQVVGMLGGPQVCLHILCRHCQHNQLLQACRQCRVQNVQVLLGGFHRVLVPDPNVCQVHHLAQIWMRFEVGHHREFRCKVFHCWHEPEAGRRAATCLLGEQRWLVNIPRRVLHLRLIGAVQPKHRMIGLDDVDQLLLELLVDVWHVVWRVCDRVN
mmetsp:Transcript_15680/g.47274  ORF Transcript_15680/g.47274 Transcript_15680/m.47274 type:complete len:233 (+) Transcript_15680:431-1129(+)